MVEPSPKEDQSFSVKRRWRCVVVTAAWWRRLKNKLKGRMGQWTRTSVRSRCWFSSSASKCGVTAPAALTPTQTISTGRPLQPETERRFLQSWPPPSMRVDPFFSKCFVAARTTLFPPFRCLPVPFLFPFSFPSRILILTVFIFVFQEFTANRFKSKPVRSTEGL